MNYISYNQPNIKAFTDFELFFNSFNITKVDRHMETVNFKEAYFVTSSKQVKEICKPLFDSFNTTYFNFVRRYENGSEICLTTDAGWTTYFYENKLYKFVIADQFARKKFIINKLKIIPWTQFSNSPVRIAQSEKFGIGIGMTLIFTKTGFTDFFHFGTGNENQHMSNLYVIYADCLIQFAYYFYDSASKIILEGSKLDKRLIISDRALQKDDEFPIIENLHIKNFMNVTQPKKFLINTADEQISLTKKEIQCIVCLTQGKTAGETGEIMHMSKRTVETHLKNSRLKLGLEAGAGKSELISELYKRKFDLSDLRFERL